MGNDLAKRFFGFPEPPGPIQIIVPGVSRKRKGSLECRNYPLFPFEVSPDDMLSSATAYALLFCWYGTNVNLELERHVLHLPFGQHRVLIGGPPTNRFVAEANRYLQIRFDENPERRVLQSFGDRRYEVAVSGDGRKAFVERDYCLVSRRVADDKVVEVSIGGLRAYGQVASRFFLGRPEFYQALDPDPRSDCFQVVVEVNVSADRTIRGWQVVEQLSKVGRTVRGKFLTQHGWQRYTSRAKPPVTRACPPRPWRFAKRLRTAVSRQT